MKVQSPKFRVWSSNLKSQISDLRSQISNLRSQISNFKFQIPGLLFAAFLALLSGCRQRDIRETVVRVPQATTPEIQAEIRAELAKIDGVEAGGAVFADGTVTVRYDSMKLGIKNIEHAIKDIGYDANDFKGEPRPDRR